MLFIDGAENVSQGTQRKSNTEDVAYYFPEDVSP